jgi:hypothetical protein
MRVHIPVAMAEFDDSGNTIWIHAPNGSTVFRIKCTGKFIIDESCNNNVAHSDILVDGDIEICLPPEE